ncbi:MAG: hypothetical protein AAGF23_12350 [Acidobacteriota bacterium]
MPSNRPSSRPALPTSLTTLTTGAALLAAIAVVPATASPTDEIFVSGFEQGTVLDWSAAVGADPVVPPEVCAPPISPVDTAGATVVGTGTAASCTEATLRAALQSNNGAIRSTAARRRTRSRWRPRSTSTPT